MRTKSDRVFYAINNIFMFIISMIALYPMLVVVFSSFSDPVELAKNTGLMFKPAGFSLRGYATVFKDRNIYIGYANTLFYVIVGTSLQISMTLIGAYALSRKDMMLKKPVMLMITFTMFFSGGMIPSFLVVKDLGLYNSRFALIIPPMLSTWNLFVLKTSFEGVPESLLESARIDGANEFTILRKIVLPVSMASIIAIWLFYAVGKWNAWFGALLYLKDRTKYPLQMFLRELLIIPETSNNVIAAEISVGDNSVLLKEVIKYCTIIVSSLPILMCYPFLQKYFVKGVLIGSIKG